MHQYKMKKKIIILTAFLLVISLSFFVTAVDVCCEKTLSGAWCKLEDKNNCDLNGWGFAQTSCDQTTFCKKGTCVNEQAGTCTSNTPEGACTNSGGVWYDKDKDDLPACKIGCCIAGQEVAFVNPTECQQIASDHGINVEFREDITSLEQCLTLSTSEKKGACVFSETTTQQTSGNWFNNLFGGSEEETASGLKNCIMTTQQDCVSQGGFFNSGLLCSAQGLSNCAKSKNTQCYKEKVYFLDTCGNLANVYDENMYSNSDSGWTAAMQDYWTNIQDPICSVNNLDGTCGDCSYRKGTICAKYETGDEGMPSSPKFGDNVCRDLGCYYEGEYYEHTESWCAKTPGTFPHVPLEMTSEIKNELRDSSKYNLPGSRYVKLKCYDGEVLVEECKDYRNSICKESTSESGYIQANCIGNAVIECPNKNDKTSCEAIDDCKWVEGYRKDFTKIGVNGNISEEQGGCYPLFAPGLEFWESLAEDVCSTNMVIEPVIYEGAVRIMGDKDKYAEMEVEDVAHKCLENCYALPGYGSGYDEETLKKFQLEEYTLSETIGDSILSRREGYYCLKDEEGNDSIDNAKTGFEAGNTIDCDDDNEKDLDKRRTKNFYTHEAWLTSIRDRTRSTGDCGYKPSAFSEITGYLGDENSEIVKVTFQKLKQDLNNVKYNVTIDEIIYKGNDMTPVSTYRSSE